MKHRPARSRLALLAVTMAASAALLLAAPVGAIPPDGASPDTPGTTATVSPRTVSPGDVIEFTVTGFPAGETINVKIDDGLNCTEAALHGACVYHQQAIPSSGRVTGRFTVPTDLSPGVHWLRFLASQPILDRNGAQIGVNGFTARGNSDFTVVVRSTAPTPPAAASPNPAAPNAASPGAAAPTTPSGGTGSSGAALPDGSTTAGAPGAAGTGGVAAGDPTDPAAAVEGIDEGAPVEAAVDDGADDATEATEEGADGGADSDDGEAAAATVPAAASAGSGFPVVGAVAVLLALCVAGAAIFYTRRRPA